MSNTNNNMQTQTSNALHNAIVEAGGKDRPPMLAPGNYVQWKSRIKRYIDTKPNHELIHFCLKNPPYQYKFKSTDVDATPAPPGNDGTPLQQQPRGEVMETFATVPEDIQKWITTEAVHIILTGIDDDIYSTVDACPNAMEMWKAIERYDRQSGQYDNQRAVNVAGARKNVGKHVVQQTRIQCYNCKEFRQSASGERKSAKRPKDLCYHKVEDVLCKQEEARIQLSAEQVDWRDDTDEEPEDQELEAHYMYMAKIQEVTPDVVIILDLSLMLSHCKRYKNDEDEYNVFANDSNNEEETDQDDDLAKEHDLLTFLIEKLGCEIDDSINRNKLLKSSNKTLYEKLKCEIDNSKNQNKIFESSNKALKEACKEIADVNKEMSKAIDKFQNELDRYKNANFVKDVENECAKAYGLLAEHKLQDKNIAISELKKFIEKMKGKSVETKFDKSSVVRQPNAFKSKKQSVLGEPTPFSDSLEKKDFSKSRSTIKNLSHDLSKPVTPQILPQKVNQVQKNTNVIAPGMYKMDTRPNQTRTTQLHQDIRKTNKRVSFTARVIPTTSVSRPQLKSNRLEDRVMHNNSQVKIKEVEDHLPISTREPKRKENQSVATPHKKIVTSESTIYKSRSTSRKPYEHGSKTCSWWYPKLTPPGYKWKPKSTTGNVKPNDRLPIGIKSRTSNILEHKTLTNTPLSSNSFAARRDNPIHRRLWVLKAHDGKSQACT
ncbi:hypothetical protein Tco_1575883 [Tanacetum coccineum]